MIAPTVDWKALEFKCLHEDSPSPKVDEETEAWYRQASADYKAGIKTGNEDLLRRSNEQLLKAAERGHIKAMNNLVVNYLKGEGVKQSDAKAVEWAEALVKRESGRGYYHMGVFLEQGIGVKQDRQASLVYFRKSADLGNPQGQLVSGKKLASAVAQSPSDERDLGFSIARSMLQCSLDQGLSEAGFMLGMHYQNFEEKMPEALKAFQASGKLGHTQSLWTLQSLFQEGKYSIEKDEARAACYKRLMQESEQDQTKRFPDIDKVCPLPPKKMPGV